MMNKKLLVVLKYVINIVYMFIVLFVMEMFGQIPFIQTVFRIEDGSLFDVVLNWWSAMIVYAIGVWVIITLVFNAREFAKSSKNGSVDGTKLVTIESNSKTKSTEKKFCSIFNPLC